MTESGAYSPLNMGPSRQRRPGWPTGPLNYTLTIILSTHGTSHTKKPNPQKLHPATYSTKKIQANIPVLGTTAHPERCGTERRGAKAAPVS